MVNIVQFVYNYNALLFFLNSTLKYNENLQQLLGPQNNLALGCNKDYIHHIGLHSSNPFT